MSWVVLLQFQIDQVIWLSMCLLLTKDLLRIVSVEFYLLKIHVLLLHFFWIYLNVLELPINWFRFHSTFLIFTPMIFSFNHQEIFFNSRIKNLLNFEFKPLTLYIYLMMIYSHEIDLYWYDCITISGLNFLLILGQIQLIF